MDYKRQVEQAKYAAEKWRKKHPIVGVGELRVDFMVDGLCRSIMTLLARADAAEQERDRLREILDMYGGEYGIAAILKEKEAAEARADRLEEELKAHTETDLAKAHEALSADWAKQKWRAEKAEKQLKALSMVVLGRPIITTGKREIITFCGIPVEEAMDWILDYPKLKRKLEKAERCINAIEDDLDRGNDNDWAREHIAVWRENKE